VNGQLHPSVAFLPLSNSPRSGMGVKTIRPYSPTATYYTDYSMVFEKYIT